VAHPRIVGRNVWGLGLEMAVSVEFSYYCPWFPAPLVEAELEDRWLLLLLVVDTRNKEVHLLPH
jgi:hypothetical protein